MTEAQRKLSKSELERRKIFLWFSGALLRPRVQAHKPTIDFAVCTCTSTILLVVRHKSLFGFIILFLAIMVQVEEMDETVVPPSQERLLDADEIEKVAATLVTRPTAKMQLESLAKKLRKEGEALKRVEASQAATTSSSEETSEQVKKEATATPTETHVAKNTPPPVISDRAAYVPIDKFYFDAGGYSGAWVTLYIDLPGVGSTVDKENITCQFTSRSLDLIVKGYQGKNYRLFKDNLENDIDDSKSKRVIKADKILIKLAKKKTSYGSFDHWSDLTAKKKKPAMDKDKDPQAGIMDLMKEMYESGDDNMKKVIGETMMKQRNGELGKGMGGMGDMDI
jgi:calcyclin binding protein